MFDARRFARLAAAHWVEQRRGWGWFLALGMLLLALLYLFAAATTGTPAFTTDAQRGFFLTGLFVSAPVFAGRYFQSMSRTESGLLVLMRPASTLEKWLLALLVIGIGYPLAYSVAFEIVHVPAWLLAKAEVARNIAELPAGEGVLRPSWTTLDPEKYQLVLPWTLAGAGRAASTYGTVATLLLGLQGFAVLGSLHFHRTPFIKTILAAVALAIALGMLAAVSDGSPETVFRFWEERVPLTAGETVLASLFWFGVPALLWLASLFALQERELHR